MNHLCYLVVKVTLGAANLRQPLELCEHDLAIRLTDNREEVECRH